MITWIADASPLIVLAKIGRLDLLTEPERRVVYTETVAWEIEAGEYTDPARQALSAGWGERHADVAVPPALLDWGLDAGEEATIALCLLWPGSVAVLDDGDGRRAARALGISFTGTLGVILEARQKNRIALMAHLLLALHDAGMFLPAEAALQAVLSTVSEQWP